MSDPGANQAMRAILPTGGPDEIPARELRTTFGQFATGVTIVTTLDGRGVHHGLTINSFSSLSLDPPLLLWNLGHRSSARAVFEANEHWAVHVLSVDQAELARRFTTTAADKFAQLDLTPGLGSVPLIGGCCARFQCRTERCIIAGDHTIMIGRVLVCERGECPPLVFYNGSFGELRLDRNPA